MLATVDDGRLVKIEGDPENPATAGEVCLKGLSYVERVAHEDRLTSPLRRSQKGNLEPVSWEDALDGIVAGLWAIRKESGPLAVLHYKGSGSHGALSGLAEAFWNPFGGATRAHGDLCWPAGLEATRLTYGANRHSHPTLTRDSRFILLWGHNPAETNIHQWRLILEAKDRGATLAVVDPRCTDSSDGADLHIQPRPGTDGALALGMAQVIVTEGLHDGDFLRRNCEGVDPYLERVAEFPLERTAEITGLESEEIRDVALAYARRNPALLIAGFGLQRHRHAGQAMRAVALLPALTGNVGLPGGGWQYANLASDCLRPPPAIPTTEGLESRSFPTSRLGRSLQELADPPLAAAWFEKANPVSQHPRTKEVIRGLAGLELVVVVDQFLTDTTRLAHYVLPAKSLFEEEDLVDAYWHPYLQLRQKVLDPPEGVRTETEIWRELCVRFGFPTRAFDLDPVDRLRAMLPEGLEDSLETLRERPADLSGHGDVAWENLEFETPSGKVEFASQAATQLWGVDPVPGYEPLPEGYESELADRFSLQLLTCKTRERIHSQFGNLASIQEVDRPRVLDIHPEDAEVRGLKDGDVARIWNARGSAEAPVHINPGIRRGVVHVLEGRCVPDDPWMNLVTDDGVTDMGYGAVFYECRVEVESA
jgi:anaerobic selenocysteine-containing dehydrogenase